jgi:hypothetical protein
MNLPALVLEIAASHAEIIYTVVTLLLFVGMVVVVAAVISRWGRSQGRLDDLEDRVHRLERDQPDD